MGPTALGVGRGAYNDVISRSGSEQTLGLIVRLRYSDPIGLLAVASVTAGLKFNAEAKTEVGFGPRANYAGALVPLDAFLDAPFRGGTWSAGYATLDHSGKVKTSRSSTESDERS